MRKLTTTLPGFAQRVLEHAIETEKTVENARKACELVDWKVANSIGTLAAAYAETGDFEQAIIFIKRAMEMEPDSKSNENRKKMLAAFHARKPYREKPKGIISRAVSSPYVPPACRNGKKAEFMEREVPSGYNQLN